MADAPGGGLLRSQELQEIQAITNRLELETHRLSNVGGMGR